MNTQIAIGIGLVIVGLIFLDKVFFDWDNLVFLLRKLSDLIEWLAFWR